jgi:hypothetical protein
MNGSAPGLPTDALVERIRADMLCSGVAREIDRSRRLCQNSEWLLRHPGHRTGAPKPLSAEQSVVVCCRIGTVPGGCLPVPRSGSRVFETGVQLGRSVGHVGGLTMRPGRRTARVIGKLTGIVRAGARVIRALTRRVLIRFRTLP